MRDSRLYAAAFAEAIYLHGHGAFTIEMAGAVWVLPEFFGKHKGVDLISTLKTRWTDLMVDSALGRGSLEAATDKAVATIRDLWGVGGPLRTLALKTARRTPTPGSELMQDWAKEILQLAVTVLVPPDDRPAPATYQAPAAMKALLSAAPDHAPPADKHAKRFKDSFVHDALLAAEVSDEACQLLASLISLLQELRSKPPQWISEWHLLEAHEHGDPNLGNILVDSRDTLWLIDFAKSGIMNVVSDPAFFISRLLFQHFPIPPTVDEVKLAVLHDENGAAHPNLLVDTMEVKAATAVKLKEMAVGCADKKALHEKMRTTAGSDDVVWLLPRIATDEAEAEARLNEMCEVVDALFPCDAAGSALWTPSKPKEAWSDVAKLVFRLCAEVLTVTRELVVKCSQQLNASDAQKKADLHLSGFLIPLLTYALTSLRYPQLSRRHKRLAWHVVQRLATCITTGLNDSINGPSTALLDYHAEAAHDLTELRIAAKEIVVALLDEEGRLGGGEGVPSLGIVSIDKGRPVIDILAIDAMQSPSLMFDNISQVLQSSAGGTSMTNVSSDVLKEHHSLNTQRGALQAVMTKVKELEPSLHESLELEAGGPFPEGSLSDSDVLAAAKQARAIFSKLRPPSLAKVLSAELEELLSWWDQAQKVQAKQSSQQQAPRKPSPIDLHRRLKKAVELPHRLQGWVTSVVAAGGTSLHKYEAGQPLSALVDGAWCDVVVGQPQKGWDGNMVLNEEGSWGTRAKAPLMHAFMHAPRMMIAEAFEVQRHKHSKAMHVKFATMPDGLSGRRLDVSQQLVPIRLVKKALEGPSNALTQIKDALGQIKDVRSLSEWLHELYETRVKSGPTGAAAVIMLGPPASGKSCLMAHVVLDTVERGTMVPILIRVVDLQKLLLDPEHRNVFSGAWNWCDAYLRVTLGAQSERYLFLRQAMMARRVLVLLDGIDEGGTARDRVEKHVTTVLAAQGHVMLVTSRPDGVQSERYAEGGFHQLELCPLTSEQQEEAIKKRIGAEHAHELWEYIQKQLPPHEVTGDRVTGNPLMLSMVTSIFEMRGGGNEPMPSKVAELYQVASSAMLDQVERKARGGDASTSALSSVPYLTRLLAAVALEAHAAQR